MTEGSFVFLLFLGVICIIMLIWYAFGMAHNSTCYNCDVPLSGYNRGSASIKGDDGRYYDICKSCQKRHKRVMAQSYKGKHW